MHQHVTKKRNIFSTWFRELVNKFIQKADYSPIWIYLKSRREEHNRIV